MIAELALIIVITVFVLACYVVVLLWLSDVGPDRCLLCGEYLSHVEDSIEDREALHEIDRQEYLRSIGYRESHRGEYVRDEHGNYKPIK